MALAPRSSDKFLEFKNLVSKWVADERSRKISLLLTGKTGAGKSRLVNSLIGHKVAEEGRKKNPCTKTVNCYQTIVKGVEVTIWDSPGLQDGTDSESEYIERMTKIKEVDLFIYCLKMDDTRLRAEDLSTMRIFTEVFDKKIWENAVFALTFADKVEDPDAEDDSPEAAKHYFIAELREWEKAFLEHFPIKAKIDPSVVDKIPKIPTGLVRKLKLPDRENWLAEFWVHCYERMKVACRVNLLNVNKERINISDNLNFEERISKQLLHINASLSESPSGASYAAGNNDDSISDYTYPDPSNMSADSATQQNLASLPISSYPTITFNANQQERIEKSTWESFKEWLGASWEGVKTVTACIVSLILFPFRKTKLVF